MNYKLPHFVLVLTIVLCGNLAYGQNLPGPGLKKARTLDDYQPRTLKEIVTTGTAVEHRNDRENDVILHGNVLPSRVRVTYKGSKRPLPRSKKDVLLKWALKFAGFPEYYTEPYETEILFIEGSKEHWLAVKKDFVPQFGKELKEGEEVDLFVIRLGGARTDDEWEWVILVERFQKPN
jgi:hypothetical protein